MPFKNYIDFFSAKRTHTSGKYISQSIKGVIETFTLETCLFQSRRGGTVCSEN